MTYLFMLNQNLCPFFSNYAIRLWLRAFSLPLVPFRFGALFSVVLCGRLLRALLIFDSESQSQVAFFITVLTSYCICGTYDDR
jgi:hypothetical protein